jgi:methylenetetrahydrofolate reductase (NADPH)
LRWYRRFALLRNIGFLVRPCSNLPSAYPDGHTETSEDEDQQIKYLKEKVDAGADFIVTQLFYDVDGFLQWQRSVRDAGERDTGDLRLVNYDDAGVAIPIIPGIMPIQSYASFIRLTKLCGTRIPSRLTNALNPIKVKLYISIV